MTNCNQEPHDRDEHAMVECTVGSVGTITGGSECTRDKTTPTPATYYKANGGDADGADKGSKGPYTYIIMKRSSDYNPDPVEQFNNIDPDRYPFYEGINYSRPHGRVYAVFHGDSPAQALKMFWAEVDKISILVANIRSKDSYMPNLFVETDPTGDVEKTGLIRAVLAQRRKAFPRAEPNMEVGLSEEQVMNQEAEEERRISERDQRNEEDDGPSDEDEDDEKYVNMCDGELSLGMVCMWIERWCGAEKVGGARIGKMLTRRNVRPVGAVNLDGKERPHNDGREFREIRWAWLSGST